MVALVRGVSKQTGIHNNGAQTLFPNGMQCVQRFPMTDAAQYTSRMPQRLDVIRLDGHSRSRTQPQPVRQGQAARAKPRQHEENLRATACQRSGKPIAGRSKTSAQMGRKLPTKHEHLHPRFLHVSALLTTPD